MILVTGATGHIGNVLVRKLIEEGEKVRALIVPGEDKSSLEKLDIEWVEGNVLDLDSLIHAMENVDDVFHLAGIISILPGKNDLVHLVNVDGTRNVVHAAISQKVKRLVYVSSIHALKRVPHGVKIDESLPFDPDNSAGAYDRSKAEASLAVLEAVKNMGLDAVIVCPTGVIGPYDFLGSEMGLLISSWIKSRVSLLISGAYDFVDVRDVTRGLIAAWRKGEKGKVYILSGEQIEISQMEKIARRIQGLPSRIIKVPTQLAMAISNITPFFYRLFHIKPRFTKYSIITVTGNSQISSARARTELGYSPRSLTESIQDTIRWWSSSDGRLSINKARK